MSSVQHPPAIDPETGPFPKRRDLPPIPGAPEGAAWLFGPNDELGRINLLTPSRVREAKEQIKTGEIIPLNLPLDHPPLFGRKGFSHEIVDIAGDFALDDIWTVNTQAASQLDGFLHCATKGLDNKPCYYNNTKIEEIRSYKKQGMAAVAQHGIAGKGLFLDIYAYLQANPSALPNYDPLTVTPLPLSLLADAGKAQGIDIFADIEPGCILIFRTGYTAELLKRGEQMPDRAVGKSAGLEYSEEMLDWVHDSWFAAIASDNPAVEAWPPPGSMMHEFLLPKWGCSLGELWDLERLAEACAREKRAWCFLVSQPGNLAGGIASLPNAVAIL